jgi:phosphoribosylaminoimidazole-succinocarboxamide synthase
MREMMSADIILTTNLPLLSFKKGKVRDLYDLGENILIVSTDRISAFDVVLPNGIPHKGEALNRLSIFWFEKMKNIVRNHIMDVIDPRTVLVKKTKPIKIEFVVRGYLYGSAWRNYCSGKPICGIELPSGLRKAEKLQKPILTPTTKAEIGQHDAELTYEEVVREIGADLMNEISDACLRIYEEASEKAEANGIIVADTKMEFGLIEGRPMLIDELLTSDSSRFWSLKEYQIDQDQVSFDKQDVRDYLAATGWNKKPPAPELPEDVVLKTSQKYVEAYERLSGRRF